NFISVNAKTPIPIRQYGELDSYIWMDKDFVTRILYPVGDCEALNEAIQKWISSTSSYYHSLSVDSSKSGNRTELTVEYSSYLVNDRIASVLLNGIFVHPGLDYPVEIFQTFHADIVSGELVLLDDLLLSEARANLESLLIEKSGIYAVQADEKLLDRWLLKPSGLEFTFLTGEYRPRAEGTESFLIPYEELTEILVLPDKPEVTALEDEIINIEQPEIEAKEKAPFDPKKPMLALSFDDGPSVYTERLLNILSENGCEATFFVVGNMIEGNEALLQRMAEEGHEIGAHGWDHRQLTSLSKEEIRQQILQCRAKIYEACGVDTKIMRPSYGSYNDQLRSVAGQQGISLINWSVDSQDWKSRDANSIYKTVIANAKNGAIILCHDLQESTVDAMERAIPALLEQGYQLVSVSDLFTYNGGALSTGTVYTGR
ncbi:MAG: polysaccharide deacetylase family protein, partial [Oscillospiraceae bacterium]|nr:polysaccharide deacetylase family protein [Oscillospiraceae bacterium]